MTKVYSLVGMEGKKKRMSNFDSEYWWKEKKKKPRGE